MRGADRKADRFFAIDDGSITTTSRLSSAFSVSQLLLTVRIYEPFRRWR